MTASAPGGRPRTHVRRDLKSRGHAAGGGGGARQRQESLWKTPFSVDLVDGYPPGTGTEGPGDRPRGRGSTPGSFGTSWPCHVHNFPVPDPYPGSLTPRLCPPPPAIKQQDRCPVAPQDARSATGLVSQPTVHLRSQTTERQRPGSPSTDTTSGAQGEGGLSPGPAAGTASCRAGRRRAACPGQRARASAT